MAYATRLGRSPTWREFVEEFRENDVDIDLVNQPIETLDEDDWMVEMMPNMMVFADVEQLSDYLTLSQCAK